MSTILKALRRLEEEKTRGGTQRPLREEVASGPSEAPRGRRLPWLPIAAGMLGVGLGASAWYVWPYERGGEPVREDVAAEAPAPALSPSGVAAPVAGFAAAPAPEPTLAELQKEDEPSGGPPEDAFASQVEVVERPVPEPRIQPVAPKPKPAQAGPAAQAAVVAGAPRVAEPAPEPLHGLPEPAGVIARHAEVKPLRPAPPPAAAKAKAAPRPPDGGDWQEPAEPEPAPVPVASATAPAATAAAPPPPAPAAAAASAPSAGPELHVRRTQWHPDKARRSAEVELAGKTESVREGDVVGEYVVTEIRPSGVVLTRDGQKIETKIGK